jgi:hypothetical protein
MSYKIDPTLAEFDPEMNELLERERTRQFKGLGMLHCIKPNIILSSM